MRFRLFCAVAAVLVCLCCLSGDLPAADRLVPEPEGPPSYGLTIPVEILEVYDGDTVTVEVRFRQRVRLLNCWAPEVHTRDAAEKLKGEAAREYLKQLAEGKQATLWIPAADTARPSDLFTFERVLGLLWVEGQTQSLSEQMRSAGHATRTRIGSE